MITTIPNSNPRVIVIQKLYSQYINKDQKIEFKKFFSQIKDGKCEGWLKAGRLAKFTENGNKKIKSNIGEKYHDWYWN